MAPRRMLPCTSSRRPATASSVVVFPAPDGPNNTVKPGAAVKATCNRSPTRTSTESASLPMRAPAGEAVRQRERHDREGGKESGEAVGIGVVADHHRVVDRQRRG